MIDYTPSISSNTLPRPDRKVLRIVDFAPSPLLKSFIKNLAIALNRLIVYRTADLLMQDVDDNVDIVDMTIYSDNHFDFFYLLAHA